MTALSDTKQRLLNRLKSGAAPDRDAPHGIPRRPAGNTAPQSMNQEQVWTHVQMMGDTPAYNELITLHRRGPLDIPVLERTLDEMNRRHEMWRTTFAMGEDEPEQIIHPSAPPVKLRLFDLRSVPAKDRAMESVRLACADASAPFRLKQLPLWRAILVRMADEEYQLHLNLHQLLLDGVAVYRVLLPEVIAIYDAFSQGQPSPLPDPDPQYADYSVWQRRHLTNEAMEPHLAYWKQKLANPATPLSWPNFKPRPEVQTYRGATELLFLPSAVIDPLRSLAAGQSATLFMALATGFYVLMHRYTGQTDITLGTPAASRTPETEGIMGYFLNMMPVRVDLSANPTFSEALLRVRSSVVDALEHGSVPLLRLLREIRPPHDPSRNPLFQIMISLEPPMPAVDPAWDLTQSGASSGSTKMDMYLNLDTRPDGLMAPIMYNPDLLDAASVRRMFADWRALLEAAIAKPDSPIADLPLPRELPAKPGLTGRLRRWLRF
jgi:surfactin family lipopeptide synthetase A